MAAVFQNERVLGSGEPAQTNQKVLINKPSAFKSDMKESLDSFMRRMDLYAIQVPDDHKVCEDVSFPRGQAFAWFKVAYQNEESKISMDPKNKLHERFQPVNR